MDFIKKYWVTIYRIIVAVACGTIAIGTMWGDARWMTEEKLDQKLKPIVEFMKEHADDSSLHMSLQQKQELFVTRGEANAIKDLINKNENNIKENQREIYHRLDRLDDSLGELNRDVKTLLSRIPTN